MAQELVAGAEPMPQEGLQERVVAYERQLIMEALLRAGGNQRRAASALRCLPTTLNEKMRRLGLRGHSHVAWPEPFDQAFALDSAAMMPSEF